MNIISAYRQELERLDVKTELLKDTATVCLYDNELEHDICRVDRTHPNVLYVYVLDKPCCVVSYNGVISIDIYCVELQASKKDLKKYARLYASKKKSYTRLLEEFKQTIDSANKSIEEYRNFNTDYETEVYAFALKKELDMAVKQAYEIFKLGE